MGAMGAMDRENQPDFVRALIRTDNPNQDPRKETFLQMIHQTFCPTLNKYSFISIACYLETLIFLGSFIASFFTGGINNSYLLGINMNIIDYVSRNPYKIVSNY